MAFAFGDEELGVRNGMFQRHGYRRRCADIEATVCHEHRHLSQAIGLMQELVVVEECSVGPVAVVVTTLESRAWA